MAHGNPQETTPMLVVEDWKETVPPAQILNPVRQLDDYLASIDQRVMSQEQQDAFLDDLLSVAEFIFGRNTLQAALALLDTTSSASSITKVSTAHRGMFVVNGSNKGGGEQSYMCILGSVEYCSCRSFLEKTSKADGNSTVCKHLLALKLMPHLKVSCPEITTNTETEFSNLVMDRTMGSRR
jgi:predicted nucleic acid-binding Zn finger protein